MLNKSLSYDTDYQEPISENPIKHVLAILLLPFDPKLAKQVLRIIGSDSSVMASKIMVTIKLQNEIYADFISSDVTEGLTLSTSRYLKDMKSFLINLFYL